MISSGTSLLHTLGSAAPYHLLSFSAFFGASAYQSFFAGIVAYKVLPLDMFSRLQHSVFPGYFLIQTVAGLLLLATNPYRFERLNSVLLVIPAVAAAFNATYVMKKVDKVLAKRNEQVRIEGKSYKDPTASDEMKKLNKQFGKAHGISMLLNMVGFLDLLVYGVFLSSKLAN